MICWTKLCPKMIACSLLNHLKFKLEDQAFFNWKKNNESESKHVFHHTKWEFLFDSATNIPKFKISNNNRLNSRLPFPQTFIGTRHPVHPDIYNQFLSYLNIISILLRSTFYFLPSVLLIPFNLHLWSSHTH